jgi:hypothetical protein
VVTAGIASAISAPVTATVSVMAATIAISAAITVMAAIAVSTAVSVTAAITVSAPSMPPAPAIPGTRTDKEAAGKPGGTVISIGSASIRVIRVIAPITYRRTIINRRRHDFRTDSNPYCDLGVSRDCCERQSQDHRERD